MSRDVNAILTNPRTGTTVSVTRRLVDYTVTWVDDSGTPHTNSGTLTWPDILTNAALPAGWVTDAMEKVVLAAGRIILGIDPANDVSGL